MATTTPSIVCLGFIGRNNNPLHVSIFPSHDPISGSLVPVRTSLQFSLMLSSTLDIFDLRAKHSLQHRGVTPSTTSSGPGGSDHGLLLHAIDERLAAYGLETNTSVKLVAIVDMCGRRHGHVVDTNTTSNNAFNGDKGLASALTVNTLASSAGIRDADVRPVFKAMHNAYVKLLQNPFYEPDKHAPLGGGNGAGRKITSHRFETELKRIGNAWVPGAVTV